MIGTTLTQKGQATIPLPIRQKLGIQPGQKIFFEERGDDVLVRAPSPVAVLKGSLKIRQPYVTREAIRAVGSMLARRHEKAARQ